MHTETSGNRMSYSLATGLRDGNTDNCKGSLVQNVQAGSGPTQPHTQCVTGLSKTRVKRLGREDIRSPPSSAEVKNEWSCNSTLL
jgi:hypothetical protein